MSPRSSSHRFLDRLGTSGTNYENPRVEQVLAYSRLFLGSIALIGASIQPLAPPHFNRIALCILVAYTLHSLALLIWPMLDKRPARKFIAWAQISDLVWPLLLCIFTDAPNSIFFIFFFFALMASAFRWGFRETMLTAVASVFLLLLQGLMVAKGPPLLQQLLFTELEPRRLMIRCAFLLLTGFLLGYFSETEKELRAEIALTNHLMSTARVGSRFSNVLRQVSLEFSRVFDSQEVYEIVNQVTTGRVFRWDIPSSGNPIVEHRELPPGQSGAALMRGYPHTFYMQRCRRGIHIDALDDEGRRIDRESLPPLAMPIDAKSVLAVTLDIGRDWQGRFVIVNAKLGGGRERELRFAQNVMRQVAPALYSMFLFRRLRSRAGAMERARVARELHDTTIQSLISIEMQVDVLRRRANGNGQFGAEMCRLQELLRHEVMNLRELMHSLRSVEIGPHQFLDCIAQLVERFRRDTGMDARFISELQEVSLPVPVCRELVRVIQEALVNIRRHSNATSAYVRFGSQNGSWQLVIDDDGTGFPFSGRLNLGELNDFHRGPTVIKERVRAIGGELILESTPGHGSRLEITIPQKGNESYD